MELIKTEMTPLERGAAYARGEEVDRIPTTLSQGETIPPLYGYKMQDYYFSADVMVDVESRMVEDFNADNFGMGLGLRSVAEAIGSVCHYTDHNVSYIEKPAFSDYSEIEGKDLPNINKDGRLPIYVEAFSRLKEKYDGVRAPGSGLAGPFTMAAQLIGTERFLMDMVRDPEGTDQLLRYSTESVLSVCDQFYHQLGIKMTLSEPMITRDLLSPRLFKKYAKPYLDEAVERMTTMYGGKPGMHACGRTKDRWAEIVGTGISFFWVDNCESLAEFKESYGDQVRLIGNLNPVDVLKNGTPEDINKAVIECLKQGSDNPMGYTLCPGCTTPMDTTRENMVAFMNAAATYGKGARMGQLPEGLKLVL